MCVLVGFGSYLLALAEICLALFQFRAAERGFNNSEYISNGTNEKRNRIQICIERAIRSTDRTSASQTIQAVLHRITKAAKLYAELGHISRHKAAVKTYNKHLCWQRQELTAKKQQTSTTVANVFTASCNLAFSAWFHGKDIGLLWTPWDRKNASIFLKYCYFYRPFYSLEIRLQRNSTLLNRCAQTDKESQRRQRRTIAHLPLHPALS